MMKLLEINNNINLKKGQKVKCINDVSHNDRTIHLGLKI